MFFLVRLLRRLIRTTHHQRHKTITCADFVKASLRATRSRLLIVEVKLKGEIEGLPPFFFFGHVSPEKDLSLLVQLRQEQRGPSGIHLQSTQVQ